nr:5085_t:CDS:2 [Entrophospora candida]
MSFPIKNRTKARSETDRVDIKGKKKIPFEKQSKKAVLIESSERDRYTNFEEIVEEIINKLSINHNVSMNEVREILEDEDILTSSSPSPLLPSPQTLRSLSSSPPLSVDYNFYDEEELPGKRMSYSL